MDDKKRGVYKRFEVKRVDGSSEPGEKHEHCRHFVLDLHHDKFARTALLVYAKACRLEYPLLARDLERMASGVTKA